MIEFARIGIHLRCRRSNELLHARTVENITHPEFVHSGSLLIEECFENLRDFSVRPSAPRRDDALRSQHALFLAQFLARTSANTLLEEFLEIWSQRTSVHRSRRRGVRESQKRVRFAAPNAGLVEEQKEVELPAGLPQPVGESFDGGRRLFDIFRPPNRKVKIGVLSAHEHSDVQRPYPFADQGQEHDGLSRIVPQDNEVGLHALLATNVLPPP